MKINVLFLFRFSNSLSLINSRSDTSLNDFSLIRDSRIIKTHLSSISFSQCILLFKQIEMRHSRQLLTCINFKSVKYPKTAKVGQLVIFSDFNHTFFFHDYFSVCLFVSRFSHLEKEKVYISHSTIRML